MKIIYIEWVDSESFSYWRSIKNTIEDNKNPSIVKTVGYLLDENDHHILVCHSFDEANDMIIGVIKIPKKCILRKKIIKT